MNRHLSIRLAHVSEKLSLAGTSSIHVPLIRTSTAALALIHASGIAAAAVSLSLAHASAVGSGAQSLTLSHASAVSSRALARISVICAGSRSLPLTGIPAIRAAENLSLASVATVRSLTLPAVGAVALATAYASIAKTAAEAAATTAAKTAATCSQRKGWRNCQQGNNQKLLRHRFHSVPPLK